MARDGAPDEVALYEADPRGILPLERFRVPRSVRRALTRTSFEVRVSAAFDEVVGLCAGNRDGGVWLSSPLIRAYGDLHSAGFAQSVECWSGRRLVGGLFGVALGGLFTSESMFHRERDAGNLALAATGAHLVRRAFVLWDIQMLSDHTRRFGAVEISGDEYRRRLAAAVALTRRFV